ncbi:MAG: DNA alkylation repair protein [Alistipes sp.]|nr:DNA alkylation repair protein [Alistipes sp.]
MMTYETQSLLEALQSLRREDHFQKLTRFGIPTEHALGVPVPALRRLARTLRGRHDLALGLWESEWHEARILATMIADPSQTTPQMMDRWSAAFDSWDLCDQCCANLFRHLPFAWDKIPEYAARPEEFVRRTAFALIASLAMGDRKIPDAPFLAVLPLIERYADDPRNFVRKAVNWALRQIGKRNVTLYPEALTLSRRLAASSHKTTAWIGKDAVRELTDPQILARLHTAVLNPQT